MRALCGCQILEEARREVGDAPRRKARESLGRTMQTRWGCPRAKCTPRPELDIDLQEAAEDHARLTRGPVGTTCPFARGLTPWGRQVVSAHRLTSRLKGGLTVREALGREPHVWDVRALDAALVEMDVVAESDDEVRERERREREAAQPPPGPTWRPR